MSIAVVVSSVVAIECSSYVSSIVVALCEARLGLLAHEAAHLNHRVQLLYDFAMGSHKQWKEKHHSGHHTHTNGVLDPDIDVSPFMRVHPLQTLRWFHRWQWWYQWLLFPFLPVVLRVNGVIHLYSKENMGTILGHHIRALPAVLLYFVYPCLRKGMIGLSYYALTCCILGWIYGALFSVSHVNEKVEWYPTGNRVTRQLQATVDWSPGSAWANYLTVGLNHQAVHHVYTTRPSAEFCRIHETLSTHKEYRSFPTLWEALYSNALHLRRMGASDDKGR